MRKLIIGTRGSKLAQWQTGFVVDALKRLEPGLDVEIRIIRTEGDKDQVRPLADIGGLGVFTKAIEDALLDRTIDIAVHSLKDLPTDIAGGLTIAAIPAREDARDCVVSRHGRGLDELPRGATIGTSSARRSAQILARHPDFRIVPLRGNVDTRLARAHSPDYDAVVLAAAGIHRLGRSAEITCYLDADHMLPDPGQGALAVQVRADDDECIRLVARLDDVETRAAVSGERAFLRALGGGCRMPIGTLGRIQDSKIALDGLVAAVDGSRVLRAHAEGQVSDAQMVGTRLAIELLAAGASTILDVSPLAGKRILVTRARDQAQPLSDRIRALGGEPVEFPTIEFARLEDSTELDCALRSTQQYDWIVFTSANGVRFVIERLGALGLAARVLGSTRLAAIGPATERALQDHGLAAAFIPSKYLGEQVARELPAKPGENVLLLRADIASGELADGLKKRGLLVRDVDAYRTIAPPTSGVVPATVDALTLTSSSTVRHLTEILGSRRDAFSQAATFCIGPVTAQTAMDLGWHVDVVAAEHTIDGLVAAMVAYFQNDTQRKQPHA